MRPNFFVGVVSDMSSLHCMTTHYYFSSFFKEKGKRGNNFQLNSRFSGVFLPEPTLLESALGSSQLAGRAFLLKTRGRKEKKERKRKKEEKI